MDISTRGLIEIMSHEGVCLSPYLDSVGVWTIGVGITSHDGVDVRSLGKITIDQAIDLFKDRIKAYVAPVQKLPHKLNQNQFDALVSFCYNTGPGNLQKLTRGRSVTEIGEALMRYTIPKEITARRQKEQDLYKDGLYRSNGKVNVFPVSASFRPMYHKGTVIDVSKYFKDGPIPEQTIVKKAPKPTEAPKPAGNPIWEWLKNH